MSRLSRKEKRKLQQDGIIDKDSQLNTKKFTINFKPLTEGQSESYDAWKEDYDLFMVGCAGTGKTFLALAFALQEVLSPDTPYEKVILVRSAVASRDQGFLKGGPTEKLSVFTTPYPRLVNEVCGRKDSFDVLRKKSILHFDSTSFLRGDTHENAIVIVDECQNMTFHELDTIYTRAGTNSRHIYCGDTKQDDLTGKRKNEYSGLSQFMKVCETMDEFDTITFTSDDIVRSGKVKSYIKAKEKLGY